MMECVNHHPYDRSREFSVKAERAVVKKS